MPYFSFILKTNFHEKNLGVLSNKSIILNKDKKYYCKNTTIWKQLNTNKIKKIVKHLQIEKHKKFNANLQYVIFCLPPKIGLGDSIEYGLAIKAIEKAKIFKNISIAFSSNYSDLLKKTFNFNIIFPEFITDENITKYNNFFHFTSEIDAIKNQKYERTNIEEQILKYFSIGSFRKKKYNKIIKPKIISIFPISKSPIRTLTPKLLNQTIDYLLKKNLDIHLIFDKN